MGFKLFLIPAVIGGIIAGVVTQNFFLGIVTTAGILLGNWLGFYFGKKKK